jgi:uncharacterized protein YaeQ
MKIRSSLYINGQERTLQLFSVLNETSGHLLLKLAAAILFFDLEPIHTTSPEHPALQGQDFYPDFLKADLTGQITLWVECGKTTLHKLGKASRRHRAARVTILTALPHEGRQMAEALNAEGLERVEVWSFREGEWARWQALVQEQNDIIGEATESSMNLVVNGVAFVTELSQIR